MFATLWGLVVRVLIAGRLGKACAIPNEEKLTRYW